MRYFTIIGSSIEEVTSKILKEYRGKAYIINMNKETRTISIPRKWYSTLFLKPKEEQILVYKAYCGLPENNEEIEKAHQTVQQKREEEKTEVAEESKTDLKTEKQVIEERVLLDEERNLETHNNLLQQELNDLKTMMNYLVHKENYILDNEQHAYLMEADFSYHFSKELVDSFSIPVKNIDTFKTIIKEKIKLGIKVKDGLHYHQGECYLFVGSTGIGKTTTLAKLAATFFKEGLRDFTFMSFDSYKLGADEQLKKYAQVFEKDFYLIQSPTDFETALSKIDQNHVLFIDTAGESLEKEVRLSEIKDYLKILHKRVTISLVMSANAKLNDLILMKEKFSGFDIGAYIITKIDETKSLGPVLEFLYKQSDKIPIVYYTDGQDVPDDIKKMDLDALFKYF